jgi:hypothetical protein
LTETGVGAGVVVGTEIVIGVEGDEQEERIRERRIIRPRKFRYVYKV